MYKQWPDRIINNNCLGLVCCDHDKGDTDDDDDIVAWSFSLPLPFLNFLLGFGFVK